MDVFHAATLALLPGYFSIKSCCEALPVGMLCWFREKIPVFLSCLIGVALVYTYHGDVLRGVFPVDGAALRKAV